MTTRFLLILPVILAAGCSSEEKPDPRAIPSDAKFTDAKDPTITANTHFAAGALAEAMDQPSKAMLQYEEALKIDPKFEPALYKLGLLNTQQKNYPAAIDAWQRYLVATNYAAKAYGNLALCYQLSGDSEKAEATFKKGIEKSPKDQTCRVNYGLMLAHTGRPNEALTQLQSVLTPAEAHYNLGSIYEMDGKTAQAKLEYTRALELDPTFYDAQQRLADLGK